MKEIDITNNFGWLPSEPKDTSQYIAYELDTTTYRQMSLGGSNIDQEIYNILNDPTLRHT